METAMCMARFVSVSLFLTLVLAACAPPTAPQPSDNQLTLYNWEGDIPQSVLDLFAQETGITVNYQVYESQEEAIQNIAAGQAYDVVVMESRFIPLLAQDGLLAKFNYENIPNFKNISPNFRNLVYDPGNNHSIPYSWGTTGLLVRTDLAQRPVSRWSDLWDPAFAGKVAIWAGQPREALAFTLKSLGYSVNSENPAELEAALTQLVALKPHLRFIEDYDIEFAATALASNEIVIAMGYSGDLSASLDMGLQVEYIMPEEGALLWGDNFVIPANARNQPAAETFINFLLRPEVSATIVNEKYYASANDAARTFIPDDILSDPSIYPNNDILQNAEIILPLSPSGQQLYDEIWQKFMDAGTSP
jgi:spermidine/putrescine transport system substrate-binding protein